MGIKSSDITTGLESCVIPSQGPYELEDGFTIYTESDCTLYNIDGLCYHGPVDTVSLYMES